MGNHAAHLLHNRTFLVSIQRFSDFDGFSFKIVFFQKSIGKHCRTSFNKNIQTELIQQQKYEQKEHKPNGSFMPFIQCSRRNISKIPVRSFFQSLKQFHDPAFTNIWHPLATQISARFIQRNRQVFHFFSRRTLRRPQADIRK